MAPERGGWAYFLESWYFFRRYAHLTHSLALVMYACSDSVMLHALAYVTIANSVSLHFVSPSFYTVLHALPCFLLAITACTYYNINGWAYFQVEKHPLQQLHSKGGWVYFRGWAYFQDYGTYITPVFTTKFKTVNTFQCNKIGKGTEASVPFWGI